MNDTVKRLMKIADRYAVANPWVWVVEFKRIEGGVA